MDSKYKQFLFWALTVALMMLTFCMSPIMSYKVYCLIAGYYVGAIVQAGYWIGKIKDIDIRNYGSGNAGTTNVFRTLGKKAGMVTYILDAFKPIIAGLVLKMILGSSVDCIMLLFMYLGFGVVLGHNFPFYMDFHGGKGIAASSGVVLALIPYPKYCFVFAIVGFLAFSLTVLITKYVSLGSLLGITSWFVLFVIWAVKGWLPLSTYDAVEACIVVGVIVVFAYVRHRGNIIRLINGTERKVGSKKTA